MDNALTLLGLASLGPSYGYDLKQTYDRYFGHKKPLAFGQVYSTLARMLRDGYLVDEGEEVGGGPDRRRYAITEAGHTHLANWLFTPDVPSETLRSNLFAKTIVALLADQDAERLLDLQRACHMEQMRSLTALKRNSGLAQVLLCDHALFHIEADLRWIDLTSARLAQLRAEVRHG